MTVRSAEVKANTAIVLGCLSDTEDAVEVVGGFLDDLIIVLSLHLFGLAALSFTLIVFVFVVVVVVVAVGARLC